MSGHGPDKGVEDVFIERGLLRGEQISELRQKLGLTTEPWIGGYEIIRRSGFGGAGSVFEARHVRLNQRVALKILYPRHAKILVLARRFAREACTLARLNHPHLLHAFDVGRDSGYRFTAIGIGLWSMMSGWTLGSKTETYRLIVPRAEPTASSEVVAFPRRHLRLSRGQAMVSTRYRSPQRSTKTGSVGVSSNCRPADWSACDRPVLFCLNAHYRTFIARETSPSSWRSVPSCRPEGSAIAFDG